MAKKKNNNKTTETKENHTFNIKVDIETKNKIEAYAFLHRMSMIDVCKKFINDGLNANADEIKKIESIRK